MRLAAFIAAYAQWLLRARRWVFALILVQVAVCGWGVTRLAFEADGRVYFGPQDPQRQALDALERTYVKANNVMFLLEPAGGDVYTPDVLRAVDWLTEQAWALPYVTRVESLTNHPLTQASEDGLTVDELVPDPAHLPPAEIARIRAAAQDEDALYGVLVARAGDVTAVQALATLPGRSLDEVPHAVEAARALARQFAERHPDIRVRMTGGLPGDMAFADAAAADFGALLPVTIAVIVVILVLGLRAPFAAGATLGVIALSALTTMGVAGYAGIHLNTSTVGVPLIVLTLGVCHCMHVVVALRQQRRAGLERHAAVAAAIRENAVPMFITSLTTAVSFATLNFSSAPPFRDLGNLVTLGELVGYVYAMSLLPVLLVLLPEGGAPRSFGVVAFLRAWARFVLRWRHVLLPAGLVLAGVLIAGVRQIVFDDDFVRYFAPDNAFRADTEFMEQRLTGLHAIHWSLDTGQEMGVADPAYLARVEAFAAWLKTQPHVTHVYAFSDVMKRLNRSMHGDDPAWERLPESRELAAQYLLLYELSLPAGQELGTQLDITRGASRVVARVAGASSAEIRQLGSAGDAWLRAHAPALATQATGLSMAYAYLSERNVRRMVWGTFAALTLVSAILLVVLRSPSLGVLSLVPNLLPISMAYGVWGYVFGQVNLTVSVVGAMTLGIVVDDTVHLISHYRDARVHHGLDPAAAVHAAFGSVGEAVVLSSLALFGGFAVLATSDFGITRQMGQLCTITIALALLAELVLLPPLLLAWEDLRQWRRIAV